VLYWRVRANDWSGQGLNWSCLPIASGGTPACGATQTFVRTLPAPVPSAGNATGGEPIPVLNWSPVQGAIGYEQHVDKVDGSTLNFSFPAASATPLEWYGVGVWRWQVRADFPGTVAGQTVTSGYSVPQEFVRTLNAPSGARGIKSGARLVIEWNPDPAAKQYEIDVSTTDGFANMIDSHRTDNTSWAPEVKLTPAENRGRLFWRVAPIDGIGNVGSFASGSFAGPRPRLPACSSQKSKNKRGKRVASCKKRKS
jgi:hypothetical protein